MIAVIKKAYRKKSIVFGVAILSLGAFVAKFLGAIYRIPLTRLIGAQGLGLHQMVFPVYAVLLEFSGAALPSALSKIISCQDKDNFHFNAYNYLVVALKIFGVLGVVASLGMAIFSAPLASAQGNINASTAYLTLAPAVLLVSLISCFRGYFQGLMQMDKTALSQVIEQAVKVVFGLGIAYLFLPNVTLAVAGATLAITISEALCLLYLYTAFRKDKKVNGLKFTIDKTGFKLRAKELTRCALPITITGIMLPLSQVLDSVLTLNILGSYLTNATALYGLLSGVALTVVNLPVSILHAFCAVAIPTVSGAKTKEQKSKKTVQVLLLTVIASIPCALFLYFFAPFTVNLLFGSLSAYEKGVAVGLIKFLSVGMVAHAVLHTTNGALIGSDKLKIPLLSLSIGIVIKVLVSVLLLKNPSFNIYGGAIALNACYFISALINFIYIIFYKVKDERKTHTNRRRNA